MNVKPDFSAVIFFFIAIIGLPGCVIRLTNADRNIDSSFRKIYLPAAIDNSTHGGQSARISAAIRRVFAQDTRFELTSLQDARWALDIQIKKSFFATTKIEECKLGTEILASGAYECAAVSKNFNQPSVSSEEEQLLVDLDVLAIDLNTGKSLQALHLVNVSSGAFPVVGDANTRTRLKATPQLHALRYVENRDAAVDSIANAVASQIIAAMLTLKVQEIQ